MKTLSNTLLELLAPKKVVPETGVKVPSSAAKLLEMLAVAITIAARILLVFMIYP